MPGEKSNEARIHLLEKSSFGDKLGFFVMHSLEFIIGRWNGEFIISVYPDDIVVALEYLALVEIKSSFVSLGSKLREKKRAPAKRVACNEIPFKRCLAQLAQGCGVCKDKNKTFACVSNKILVDEFCLPKKSAIKLLTSKGSSSMVNCPSMSILLLCLIIIVVRCCCRRVFDTNGY